MKRYRVTSSHITQEAREKLLALGPCWPGEFKGDKYPKLMRGLVYLNDGTPVRLLTSEEAKQQLSAHGKHRPARLQAECRICRKWFSTGTFMQHFTPCLKANTPRILGKVVDDLSKPSFTF
jgi:hypothetical protein